MTAPVEDVPQRELDKVIRSFIVGEDTGGFLTGYVLVAHVVTFDEDGSRRSFYPVVVLDNEQSRHLSVGLLEIAREQIDSAQYIEYDEED